MNIPLVLPAAPAAPAHPWRRVLRTVLASLPGFLVGVPLVINALGIDKDTAPTLYAIAAAVLVVTAALTRVLALPQVEQFLQRTVKWLAANDVDATTAVPIQDVAAVVNEQGQLVAGPASVPDTGTLVTVLARHAWHQPEDTTGVVQKSPVTPIRPRGDEG